MKIKKIMLSILLAVIIIFLMTAMSKETPQEINSANSNKIQVVVSNFASYDFLRAIIGDTENIQLTFLLGPGKEAHSYEPTSQDLIKMQKSDLFVYIGGELEPWSEKVVELLDKSNKNVICISDYIEVSKEKDVDGAEEENSNYAEGTFDTHIWTSPTNAIKMVETLEEEIEKLDKENAENYKINADTYINEIQRVKEEIQEIVDNKIRNRLIFGDKMPMQYFIDEYNLEVSAAFNGCSTETDPSSSTIAYLINKVKEENIPVVLYCELGTGKVAKTIVEEANNGSVAMQIQTLHNISKKDFENGETWVSLMTKNMEVLKKALQ